MADESQAIVKIGAETFSILELPPSSALVVMEQKDFLLGSVDLQSLVADLGRVGSFVRLAYNGVAGFTDRQIEIRKIGYDVTKLCDKSAVTVAKFKQASGSILGDLQGTYQFLLDGLEDMALETLHSVADVAKDMADAANQLHKDFDEESQRVEKALENTMKEKESQEIKKKDTEKEEQDMAAKKAKSDVKKKAAEEDFEMYEEQYREAKAKEETFQAKASNPLRGLANAIVAPFTGGKKVFNTDADYDTAQKAREDKLMFLKEMKKQREERSKALQDIAEFSKKMENCGEEKELAVVAIQALHEAMGGLQKLSAIMMKAALFWKQMQIHCEQLAKEKMQRMIVTAMKRPEKDRLRVWTSTGFKKQAITYYAQWVALDDVCAIYMERIKETQANLYAYLEENLTLDQARRKVPELAKAFSKELEMEQKAIREKDSAATEEIERLTTSINEQ